jgi:hypothetical protein
MSESWEAELKQRAAVAERELAVMQVKYNNLSKLLTERTAELAEVRRELGRLRGEPTSTLFKR